MHLFLAQCSLRSRTIRLRQFSSSTDAVNFGEYWWLVDGSGGFKSSGGVGELWLLKGVVVAQGSGGGSWGVEVAKGYQ
jgi:hypothetical protein